MSYESARSLEIRDAHARRIEDFVRQYRQGQPTIVFLPGGMGSQLDRSDKPYRDDSSVPFRAYDPMWTDLGLVFAQDALDLEIRPDGRDRGSHIVVPNGPLRFFARPYDGAERHFRELGYNYVVFGFDWRRPVGESAGFFHAFLRRLRTRVMALRHENPLPRTTILCHSMGGLVAKVFLHRVFRGNPRPGDVRQWMAQLVTVATPFYGTANHMARYYVGQAVLNVLYGARRIARLSGTLPGPYILMFLDRSTYESHGTDLGLQRYPVRNEEDDDVGADPYDEALGPRYPPWVSRNYLAAARRLRRTVTRPLPRAVLGRVFHLRSGQDRDTWVELRWAGVGGARFDPDRDSSPISGRKGPGDGTVPAWAARLAQTPDEQVYDLTLAKSHGELMEHLETLRVISFLAEHGRLPRRLTVPDESLGRAKASAAAVNRFLTGVARRTVTPRDRRASDEKIWRRLVEEATLC